MTRPQQQFLTYFQHNFARRTGLAMPWSGGQVLANTAAFTANTALRRPNIKRHGEKFELADLAATVNGWRVVIEFESREVPLSNLLKYWPYLRGELDTTPTQPLLICHFSDWWSYATRRDLWQWTMHRMQEDPQILFNVDGKQFDHWGSDATRREQSVAAAIDWIMSRTSTTC